MSGPDRWRDRTSVDRLRCRGLGALGEVGVGSADVPLDVAAQFGGSVGVLPCSGGLEVFPQLVVDAAYAAEFLLVLIGKGVPIPSDSRSTCRLRPHLRLPRL